MCSSCYALRGRYLNPSVAMAHQRRREAIMHPLWPDAMAVLIDAYARGGHFRWFDSGDLQSVEHLDKILWDLPWQSITVPRQLRAMIDN